MEILVFLIPIALILGLIFVSFFIFTVKTGQYDDLDTPAYRILTTDEYKFTKTKEDLK
jgi:cbb3-type cytochrome oxidase maturation protein